MALGEMIRCRRWLLGWTQQDLAALSSCSQTYISQLENDEIASPNPFYLRLIAKAIEIDEVELIRAAGYIYAGGHTEAVSLLVDVLRDDNTAMNDHLLALLRDIRKLQTGSSLEEGQSAYAQIFSHMSKLSDRQQRQALRTMLAVLDSFVRK